MHPAGVAFLLMFTIALMAILLFGAPHRVVLFNLVVAARAQSQRPLD
jgi:hypothetical protein